MPVVIRKITSDEVKMLENGCREFYATGALAGELNFDQWQRHWERILLLEQGIIWAAFRDGEAVAAIGGYCGKDQSNSDLVFTEKFFFARNLGKGTGMRLLVQAESDLKDLDVKRIYMINLVNYEPEKAIKLYTYMGYKPAEVLWIKELQEEIADGN